MTARNAGSTVVVCAAFLIAGCGGSGTDQPAEGADTTTSATPDASLPPDVQLALTVAHALDAAPANTDSILSANGLTREGLDSLMYTIASDSAKAAAYTAGRR
ncbi:MAG TPA: hypothetical protein VLE53_19200 [Gemmatimonadaceae bacterium]|nr:hypothetical protein [Gemmatimonadaceae bacterium]